MGDYADYDSGDGIDQPTICWQVDSGDDIAEEVLMSGGRDRPPRTRQEWHEYYLARARERLSMSSVDARVAAILRERQAQAEVEKRLKLIEAYGEDCYPEGAVIRFKKQFAKDGKQYSYAAIKAEGKWYTTGYNAPKGFNWDEFVIWLVSMGISVQTVEKMIPSDA